MKTRLPVLLILICLLCGCAAGARTEEPSAAPEQTIQGYYDPDSTLEAQTNGALRCYPLDHTGAMALRMLPEGQLLLIQAGTANTTLTLLTEEDAIPVASTTLPFSLTGNDGAIQPWEKGLCCYDPVSRELLLLDEELREVRRIPTPPDALGPPVLSRDGTKLFYATDDALRVLELSTGISSVLKRSDALQVPVALCLQDTALICRETDASGSHTLLLCTQTGATLYRSHTDSVISASESAFYVRGRDALLFGTGKESLEELIPAGDPQALYPLPASHCAIGLSGPGEPVTLLSHYDLTTGLRTGVLQLPQGPEPQDFLSDPAGKVWFWRYDRHYGCNTLYRWDPTGSPSGDTEVYTAPYFSREMPDLEGLARCQSFARELELRYGITVRLYLDADDIQPQGYRLEYEYRAWRTIQALKLLDQGLQQYPPGFLSAVSEPFEGVTVCLVSDIRGSTQWGTLDTLPGIQFLEGNHAYIVLATGSGLQGALYHQLCHLIDTVVFTHSSAYDTWEGLNPSGFRYDYSYITNLSRNSTAYLLEDRRSFVDMFSMSFPKEDRARIMEYAMLPGNENLFRPPVMQAKLKKLCLGIREAFGLEERPEVFLWEQYLDRPLGPTA